MLVRVLVGPTVGVFVGGPGVRVFDGVKVLLGVKVGPGVGCGVGEAWLPTGTGAPVPWPGQAKLKDELLKSAAWTPKDSSVEVVPEKSR